MVLMRAPMSVFMAPKVVLAASVAFLAAFRDALALFQLVFAVVNRACISLTALSESPMASALADQRTR
jgi:hypothetical protein